MPILRWLTVLWPGLGGLWLKSEWSALFLASGFSGLVNLTVIATWGWTQLLGRPALYAAWAGTFTFWLVSVCLATRQMQRLKRTTAADTSQDLFRTAQGEYLKGNWFEAELALNRLLSHNPGDVDAQLMLAALLCRSAQAGEARTVLRRLSTQAAASKWQFEIDRQRQRLDRRAPDTAHNVQVHNDIEVRLPSAA